MSNILWLEEQYFREGWIPYFVGWKPTCCWANAQCTLGTSTNVGPTNVGRYKPKTYKRRTAQTSDQYKRQTGTNVGLVQTLDEYKRRTSTNIGPVQTTD